MFQNTLSDLQDCKEKMDDRERVEDSSQEEKEAMEELLNLCEEIYKDYKH